MNTKTKIRLRIPCHKVLPILFNSPLSAWHVVASANSVMPWQAQAGSWDDKILKVLDSHEQDGYTFKTAMYDGTEWATPEFKMTTVHNPEGHYVGDEKFALYLIKKGIAAERATEEHNVCSIGFCERENKWAGWSHRAIALFGIGDRIFDETYGNDDTVFTQHGQVEIENLDQAKQAARLFAAYVS